MAKKLKKWNGGAPGGRNGSVYVAAYNQKQAAELISKAFNSWTTISEIKNYFHSGSWGNPMNGIEPTEPCVYHQKRSFSSDKPIRIL